MEAVVRGAQPAGLLDVRRAILKDHAALERLQGGRPEVPLHESVVDARTPCRGWVSRYVWTTITGSGRRARNTRMR